MNFSFYFVLFLALHFFIFSTQKMGITFFPKNLIWYLISFCGIYYMYFLTRVSIKYFTLEKFWFAIKKIDATSYSIYLFHVTFLYIVLFLDSYLSINIPVLRVSVSFISGLFFSIMLHELIAKNKLLSMAFAIPYRK